MAVVPSSVALGSPPVITDPTFQPKERYGLLDRLLLKLLNDERDLPFAHVSIEMTLVVLPLALSWFVFDWPLWAAPLYWALDLGNYMDRYILMLHCTSHRPLFKREYRWLDFYIPWVLGPFIGETPETYYAHHIGMHHPENNLGDDISTTMPFQRDSFAGWLKYWGRFFVLGLVDLSRYHRTLGKPKMVKTFLFGELSWVALVVALSFVNFKATFVVFIFPLVFARIMMMAGNWAQHAFIDGSDPANPFKNSITCINTRYNRRAFNDGYHIGHHRLATRHWTEMPVEFSRDLQKYADNDAIVFEGIDFFGVWLLLMCKRYDRLADHFVELRAEKRSREEIIALLRSRTQRLEAPVRARKGRPAALATA